MALIVAILD